MTADSSKPHDAGGNPTLLNQMAEQALRFVESGMIVGLGTGRAAEAFIDKLAERSRRGLRVSGVPTSKRSEELALRLNLEVILLENADRIDVAFDGADEVTSDLSLTKGLGGALLRERVVAFEAERFIVLVTPEKLVEKLGTRSPIPIEIVPFAAPTIERHLKRMGGTPALRKVIKSPSTTPFPYQTDNHNWILDTHFGPIEHPGELHAAIRRIPGVVDTGIFVGLAHMVLVGEEGGVRTMRRGSV